MADAGDSKSSARKGVWVRIPLRAHGPHQRGEQRAPVGNKAAVMPFSVSLSLCLPRDEMSVPVVRHICRFALTEVGVGSPCIGDIELALTEACTNVLDHATGDNSYEVYVDIEERTCTIRVKDNGAGFSDDSQTTGELPAVTAESGRGISLMHALVDNVKFTSVPEEGMIVHLEKQLEYESDHPVFQRLTDG